MDGNIVYADTVDRVISEIKKEQLKFSSKPIVIGGMAMEYYGIRKSGADIDLVITNYDYRILSKEYPEKRKDLYGDLGVVIGKFEIWRSIALLDYDFFKKEAVDCGQIQIVSLDRLLFMRVSAMDVQKYLNDLKLIKEYYYKNFRNKDFLHEAETHVLSYKKMSGAVFGGKYEDN